MERREERKKIARVRKRMVSTAIFGVPYKQLNTNSLLRLTTNSVLR